MSTAILVGRRENPKSKPKGIPIFQGISENTRRTMMESPCIVIDLTRQGGVDNHLQRELGRSIREATELRIVEGIHKKNFQVILDEVREHASTMEKPRVFIYGFHGDILKIAKGLRTLHGVIISSGQLEQFGHHGQEGNLVSILKEELARKTA